MQQRASNHSPVTILRCTGNLWPRTHIDAKRVNHAYFNNFQAHRRILAICHMSWISFQLITHGRFGNPIWYYSMSWWYWIAVSEYETPTWLIPGKAAAFAVIWFNFRGTGQLSAYVLSCVMGDPVPFICQSNLARRQSRRYCVLVSEFESQLAHLWQSRINCWGMVKVQVHPRVLGTCRPACCSIIANPIPQWT
jgi:hypothetical protein